MEAVALGWVRIGIRVKRVPEAISSYISKGRARKTNKTFVVIGSPPHDEPVTAWQRAAHCKGLFPLLIEGQHNQDVEAVARELNAERRARLSHNLA
jgi:hypothetical protein